LIINLPSTVSSLPGYATIIRGGQKMEIYDLMKLDAQGYEKRQVNVFFQNDTFKARVIVLEAGGKIPECQMDTFVMFYVVKGEVTLRKNAESFVLKENQVFITEPALLSMESKSGARLMGIQINT
jgi:mannose-6-phosphate isomerase class I